MSNARFFMGTVRPEIGKYYLSRRGEIYGPIVHIEWRAGIPLHGRPTRRSLGGMKLSRSVPGTQCFWFDDGSIFGNSNPLLQGKKNYAPYDLVEEINKEDIPHGTRIIG
jgi:hypothetical protein